MDDTTVTQFVQSLAVRRGHCHALLELTRRQHDLVADAQYGQLVELLRHKQHVLDRLADVVRAQPVKAGDWNTLREQASDELRTRADGLLDELAQLLKTVAEEEAVSLDDLKARRDETARQIAALSQGSQVQRAYADSLAPVKSRRLDVKH